MTAPLVVTVPFRRASSPRRGSLLYRDRASSPRHGSLLYKDRASSPRRGSLPYRDRASSLRRGSSPRRSSPPPWGSPHRPKAGLWDSQNVTANSYNIL